MLKNILMSQEWAKAWKELKAKWSSMERGRAGLNTLLCTGENYINVSYTSFSVLESRAGWAQVMPHHLQGGLLNK